MLCQRAVASDDDTYHCYAFNKFGSSSAEARLVVLSRTFSTVLDHQYTLQIKYTGAGRGFWRSQVQILRQKSNS